MKKLLYFVYSVFFHIGRLLPVKNNRVALISPHNAAFTDSLGCIAQELKQRDGFDLLFISRAEGSRISGTLAFLTVKAAKLARSKTVFLNDNFMPLADLNFSQKTRVIQLWHAEGAFKKFGLDIEQPPQIRERERRGNARLSFVVCSGEGVRDIYASAFGVDKDRVLPLGSARTDPLLNPDETKKLKANFFGRHPDCKGKKIVLYAPTFRDSPQEDKRLLDSFDADALAERLGEEYALLVRLHPQIHSAAAGFKKALDVTDYDNVNELTAASDVLITDYSSICMDFVLQGKPVVFYAFDLKEYTAKRPLYFDYEAYAPGKVTKEFSSLPELVKSASNNDEKAAKFAEMNFGALDGNSTQRIVKHFF